MSRPALMVLDGELRATLGIVRSLGRLGIPIVVGSNDSLAMAGASRYAIRRFTYPPAESGVEAAHAVIIERVRAWRPDILMPVFGQGWSTIHAFYEEYERLTAVVPNPSQELFENLRDKAQLAAYAEQHGIPIPRTLRPRSRDEAVGMADQLPYPVLLKPRRSVSGFGIRRVYNRRELVETLARRQDVPVIQEYIEGEDLELRLAGTNEVSMRSGVNFPLMLYRLALGERVEPCFTYTVGLEFRWLLFGELLHFLQTPAKHRTVRELLWWRGVATNVSLSDPLPHIADGLSIIRRRLTRTREGRAVQAA